MIEPLRFARLSGVGAVLALKVHAASRPMAQRLLVVPESVE
jgi:hypothetical protein